MILRPTPVAAGPATTTTPSDTPSPSPTSFLPPYGSEQWNSLIGIITAIVGNVLISFALNAQRYAHIRLEREWQEKERMRKRRSARYRDEEEDVAATGGQTDGDGTVPDGDVASEDDPLLPIAKAKAKAKPARSYTGDSRSALEPVQEEDEEEAGEAAYKQKSYLKSPYWWAGIILMTTGEAGNFLAYGFAPASIVSPLGVVALISNCIIAPFMLKEPFRKRDGLGVMVAVGGAVTVVASASDNNPKLGPDEIWDLISTWEFETYFGITVAVIIALMFASNRFGQKSVLIDLGLVGLFGGYTALSTKGVASMLSYTLWRAITFPVTYLLVAILVGTAIMQIKYVNRALQRFDATIVIPVQFVLFTLSVILGSAVLYRDFERTSGDDAGKFVGGCAMTFLGVWLITSGRSPRNNDEEERSPEPVDAINLVNGEPYHDYVDDPIEGEEGESRRSSTVRATSPPIDTTLLPPSRGASQATTPDATFTPNLIPSTPPQNDSVPASLIMNPWEQSESFGSPSHPSRPDQLSRNSTLSTPVLPSEITDRPGPSTSTPELSTNPPRPHTPTRQISDTAAMTPTAPSPFTPRLRRIGTAERAARSSITGPLLASPLSNSLSAMVADLKRSGSLRAQQQRDGAAAKSEDARRRQSVLGIGAGEEEGGGLLGEPLDRRKTATGVEEGGRSTEQQAQLPGGGRGRSLSGTLGDLWRGWRGNEGESEAERRAEGAGEGDGGEEERR